MGMLDWLQDALGGVGNAASDPMTMGGMSSAGTPAMAPPSPPMPPVQQTGADQPQIGPMPPMPPQGGGIGSDAARAPDQPPIPQRAPPAPPMAPPGVTAPSQSAVPPVPILPPNASSTEGITPPSSGPGPQARGILGRALGLDANSERRLSGGLAQGLKAAGNSSGKSPFQALASGAGATLEGGDNADETTTKDQQKYLAQAIEAQKAGDSRGANLALTQLRQAQTQMVMQGKGGKDSVVNSPEQLYARAQSLASQDGRLKALKTAADQAGVQFGPDSPQAKKALQAHKDAYDATVAQHAASFGLTPKEIQQTGKKPGMSFENPIPKNKMTSQEAFDKLTPGSFFVNPKDGQVLMKPMKGVGGAAAAMGPNGAPPAGAPAPGGQNLPAGQGGTPAPTGTSLPPMPPKAPTNPVATSNMGYGADEGVDEKEPA